MNTAKAQVNSMLQNIPDDATIEDMQYHLYVLEKIKRSEERLKNEGALTHNQVKERLAKWLNH